MSRNVREDREFGPKANPGEKIWYCRGCKQGLGVVDKDGKELRIKFRDQYIWIGLDTGYVRTVGRSCSTFNEVKSGDLGAPMQQE